MWQDPNPDWTIYARHFSILLAVVKMHSRGLAERGQEEEQENEQH